MLVHYFLRCAPSMFALRLRDVLKEDIGLIFENLVGGETD